MQLLGEDDLQKRLPPRLEKFHTNDPNTGATSVLFWKKGYLNEDYCEAKYGYVCQRPAAAGAASDAKGKLSFFISVFLPFNLAGKGSQVLEKELNAKKRLLRSEIWIRLSKAGGCRISIRL